jgi:peptidyl-prolyl cis-trans isomerase B (cyclophilin B)
VTSLRDRQRAAARARLEREMTERAEQAQRRRRLKMTIAGSVSLVVLVGAIATITVLVTGNDKGNKKSAAVAQCNYQPAVDPSASASLSPSLAANIKKVGAPPESSVVRSGVQLLTIDTSVGSLLVQVDTEKAPCTAASFTYLASKKYFDGTICHRMTTSQMYVLQCGDPTGTGMGGPDYKIADENLPVSASPAYPVGTVAMANAGSNTNGSQFFIVYGDTELSANYTVLGHVLRGLDVIKKVAAAGVVDSDASNPGDGKPKLEVKITGFTMSKAAESLPSLPAVTVAPSTAASAGTSVAPSSSGSAAS